MATAVRIAEPKSLFAVRLKAMCKACCLSFALSIKLSGWTLKQFTARGKSTKVPLTRHPRRDGLETAPDRFDQAADEIAVSAYTCKKKDQAYRRKRGDRKTGGPFFALLFPAPYCPRVAPGKLSIS